MNTPGTIQIVSDAPARSIDEIRTAINAIGGELNATFAERDREIRGILIAVLAREHLLLLGPAGTAKSALAHTFCSAIDGATYFQWLVGRFSSPEELFGPISLSGLKEDHYRRVTVGKLPEAHVAFIDEIYKANTAVLNSMLTALNERAFDDDGRRHRIPLETVVAASNELPESSELAALHDRFLLRFWVSYTSSPEAFNRLITGPEPAIAGRLTMADVKAAQAAVAAMPMDANTVNELFNLRKEIAALGITASDRRWRRAAGVLRASAWLDGATEVTPESFSVLGSVLWETTAQIPKLQPVVQRYTSAQLAEAQECVDAISGMLNDLPEKTDPDYAAKLINTTKEVQRARDRLTELAGTCSGRQSKLRIESMASNLNTRYDALRRDAAAALGL